MPPQCARHERIGQSPMFLQSAGISKPEMPGQRAEPVIRNVLEETTRQEHGAEEGAVVLNAGELHLSDEETPVERCVMSDADAVTEEGP